MTAAPGPVVLFGSGETSTTGRTVFDWLLRQLRPSPRIAILETPAGFQPNSGLVAQEIADFLEHRLRNYRPETHVVPARKKGTPLSPDEAAVVAPLCQAEVVFLGPGSPTYAVNQLRDSLAWQYVREHHLRGGAVVFASAAAIAAGFQALPVYEIYKVGADLHWQPGLDFFRLYGLSLTVVPHWDNREGGDKLDTSHCFMGRGRFEQLAAMLPGDTLCVGIDEHTVLVMEPVAGTGHVRGKGAITLLQQGRCEVLTTGTDFPLDKLGAFRLPVIAEPAARELTSRWNEGASPAPAMPAEVAEWVAAREQARRSRDWAAADALRQRIVQHGWQVRDTGAGPEVTPLPVKGDGAEGRASALVETDA